ncbi:MAG: transcription-repair coupling factor [Syntrophomonadaceae bacterium]|nr:transcription-repair coupling factor [Syntrophomonadaceae bacterium]
MEGKFWQSIHKCRQKNQNILLTGLSGTAKSFTLAELQKNCPGKLLCLVPGEEKAYDLARDLQGLVGEDKVLMFLGREFVFMKENYSQLEIDRILTLQDCLLHPRRSTFIIATPGAFMYPLLAPEQFKASMLELNTGEEIDLNILLRQLVDGGYVRVDTITRTGEFALRGGIMDIYPVNAKQPVRIELFGDFIDSMRLFDVNTQRSGRKTTCLHICPADELYGENLHASLIDYLREDTGIFFDEPREFYKVLEKNQKRYRDSLREAHREKKNVRELELLDRNDIADRIKSRAVIYHSFFPANIPQVSVGLMEHVSQQEMEPFYGNHELLFNRLREWQKKEYTIRLSIRGKLAAEQLQKELSDGHITNIEISGEKIETGFISQTLKIAIVSDRDIWGRKPEHSTRRRKKVEERVLIEDLKLGDYVVHENYGIGIFRGVTNVETDGITREYILLEYAGTDKLYLPVDKLDVLYKYNASEAKNPRLSKLGGTEWERTRKKVAGSIQEMAGTLLRLYAQRQAQEGFAFSPDTPWQRQFEDSFPFQETPDQLKAINEVKKDMESRRPMDRLICGDVGYGKTEVAMRAAFKAIMDGKQVAILVPTTVLAEQHFQSFRERFAEYPATIEVLSRFRTAAQQKKIIADLKKGLIDIIIGTHRILSKDLEFKDLGLLIIDEEHRFGVAQKEKIKAYKELVDVISLSATPIPRSLHMSMTGLRDLSVIDTPPPERYPITTYVLEYNEEIIRESILAEIERGGQVFVVHNRIEDIYRIQKNLVQMLPEVSIVVGHGRMKEDELSQVMMDFVRGKYQVFLCTTIIESGLDMPNVNTIIIDEADKMGLAQLYQLRGRVGRSNRIAYAYLIYRPDRIISETAQKRLNSIREFNELGSGIKIALRDLEIRGAGNILGSEQHGYIQAVGFDMYCRLLEQEAARIKGNQGPERINPQMDIDVDYYIPDSYIPDSGTKMRIYRRMLLVLEHQEIEDIRNELRDRFGPLPQPVENFLRIASLRIVAREKEIKTLRRKGRHIQIQLADRLPHSFSLNIEGYKMKKINDYTLELQLDGMNSLENLQKVLSLI